VHCGTYLHAEQRQNRPNRQDYDVPAQGGYQQPRVDWQNQPPQQPPQYQPYPQQQPAPVAKKQDAPSGGFAFLCFLYPIVGLILYLVWKDDYPLKAKSCGKGALASVITGVAVSVLWFIIFICVALSVGSY
jgi:hypothetical protein